MQRKTAQFRIETIEARTLMSAVPHLGEPATPTHDDKPATTVPARASNLTAAVTGLSVKLTWKDNSTNEAGFDVFRLNPATHGLQLVGHVDANVTTFTEATAPIGADVYMVRAVNADGKGEVSNAATAKVVDTVTVSAPNKLQTNAVSTTSVQIKWDGAKNAVSYQVLRSLDGSTNWTPIGTTTAAVHTFTDTNLTAGTRYYYRIVAVGATGTTATSATVIGQTKANGKGDAAKGDGTKNDGAKDDAGKNDAATVVHK